MRYEGGRDEQDTVINDVRCCYVEGFAKPVLATVMSADQRLEISSLILQKGDKAEFKNHVRIARHSNDGKKAYGRMFEKILIILAEKNPEGPLSSGR